MIFLLHTVTSRSEHFSSPVPHREHLRRRQRNRWQLRVRLPFIANENVSYVVGIAYQDGPAHQLVE